MFVNYIKKNNVLLVWFPAGQGLKKKLILVLFLKLDKILYHS